MVLSLGCGAAGEHPDKPSSRSTRTPPVELLSSTPEEPIPKSECGSVEACRSECDEGAVNACTRFADLTYEGKPEAAEQTWRAACQKRDAAACARLMQMKAAEPSRADRYGWKACAYGDVRSCEYVANALVRRAVAPAEHEDAEELFRSALAAYRRACELTSWFGCARAALTLQHLGDAPPGEARGESHRALGMARAACDDRDASACRFLAKHAEGIKNQDLMKDAYRKGCRAHLEKALPDHGEGIKELPMCQRAQKLGVMPARPEGADGAAERETWTAARSKTEAKRISGETHIVPPRRASLVMHEHGITLLDARIQLCLSRFGRVTKLRFLKASRSAGWDRKIFEAMRQWRYTPFEVDGEPKPVCTRIVFIYEQDSA